MTTYPTQDRPGKRRPASGGLFRIGGGFCGSSLCRIRLDYTARRRYLQVRRYLRSCGHAGVGGLRLSSGAPDTRHLGILRGGP
jgi:hypothetical protein